MSNANAVALAALSALDKADAFAVLHDWMRANATAYKAVAGESFQIDFPESGETYEVLVQDLADFL